MPQDQLEEQMFVSIKCMAGLRHCHDQEEKHKLSPAAERKLVRKPGEKVNRRMRNTFF